MKATFDFKAFQAAVAKTENGRHDPVPRERLNPYIMERIVGPMEAGGEVLIHDVDYSRFTREELKAVIETLCYPHIERSRQNGLVHSAKAVQPEPARRPMFI